jgi:proline- and glutamine-rich splicing factor
LNERLAGISAPTHDLPPQDTCEKKFTDRCRLYIGNLTSDVTEDEITQLFQPYGETAELFVGKEKNSALIRLVSDCVIHLAFKCGMVVVKVYNL